MKKIKIKSSSILKKDICMINRIIKLVLEGKLLKLLAKAIIQQEEYGQIEPFILDEIKCIIKRLDKR